MILSNGRIFLFFFNSPKIIFYFSLYISFAHTKEICTKLLQPIAFFDRNQSAVIFKKILS